MPAEPRRIRRSLGLASNDGTFLIGDSDTVTTTGAFSNSGSVYVDSQYGGQGGATLTFAGALANSGTFNIGIGDSSAATMVNATSLSNSGTINLSSNFPGSNQATLDITGTAGFGTAGVVTGSNSLIGNTLIEFGSGQITTIAGGATLSLRGQAPHRRRERHDDEFGPDGADRQCPGPSCSAIPIR